MAQQRVPVWVKALDPLSRFGLMHALRQRPEILLISDADLAEFKQTQADQRTAPPLVALVVVDSLDTTAVQVLRSAAQQGVAGSC